MSLSKYIGNGITKILEEVKIETQKKEISMEELDLDDVKVMWDPDGASESLPMTFTLLNSESQPLVKAPAKLKKTSALIDNGTTNNNGLVVWDNPNKVQNNIVFGDTYTLSYTDNNTEYNTEVTLPVDGTYANVTVQEGNNELDTDGHPGTGSSDELKNWEYETWDNYTYKSILLKRYKGNEEDVVVYGKYFKNGFLYKTQIYNLYDGLFENCMNIKSITFNEGIDYSKFTNARNMFRNCYSLTTINFPEDFDSSKVVNMSNMFGYCKKLTYLDLSNFNTSNVTDMYCMFMGCSDLQTLDLSSFNTINVTNMSCMFNCATYESDYSGIDYNGEYKFKPYSSLYSIIFSDSFWTENVTSMCSMFDGCIKLTSLDLSTFNTYNVTDMSKMFSDCESLRTLEGAISCCNVTSMAGMFYNCINLTINNDMLSPDIYIQDTSNVTNMAGMFYNCKSLMSDGLLAHILFNLNTSKVTGMRYMFYNCTSLDYIDLSNFDTSNVEDMDSMFKGCTNLTEIHVSRDKWVENTSSNMFYNCGTDHVTYVD